MASHRISQLQRLVKLYIRDLQKSAVSSFNSKLIADKAWRVVGDPFGNQKLIFRKGGEILFSHNGTVATGSWEFVKGTGHLLVRKDGKIYLFNCLLGQDELLALALDGENDDIVILLNESKVDLQNAMNFLYAQRKRINPLIHVVQLEDGEFFEVALAHVDFNLYHKHGFIGKALNPVVNELSDGDYRHYKKSVRFKVQDMTIKDVIYESMLITQDQQVLYVEHLTSNGVEKGDKVYLDENRSKFCPDGDFRINRKDSIVMDGLYPAPKKIVVRNGVVQSSKMGYFI